MALGDIKKLNQLDRGMSQAEVRQILGDVGPKHDFDVPGPLLRKPKVREPCLHEALLAVFVIHARCAQSQGEFAEAVFGQRRQELVLVLIPRGHVEVTRAWVTPAAP